MRRRRMLGVLPQFRTMLEGQGMGNLEQCSVAVGWQGLLDFVVLFVDFVDDLVDVRG